MAERFVHGGGEDEALQEIFAPEEVEYVHARSTSAGSYLFRIERAKSD